LRVVPIELCFVSRFALNLASSRQGSSCTIHVIERLTELTKVSFFHLVPELLWREFSTWVLLQELEQKIKLAHAVS